MKIISKYKDYYDYMVYKFGIDPLVVIDRREGVVPFVSVPNKEDTYERIRVAICGKLYNGLIDSKGEVHWGENMLPLGKYKSSFLDRGKKRLHYKHQYFNSIQTTEVYPEITDINDKEKCPVVLLGNGNILWPKLEELNFAGYFPADKIFLEIYNWVSARNEKQIEDTRDDTLKLLNAGFDKKKSFRHRK